MLPRLGGTRAIDAPRLPVKTSRRDRLLRVASPILSSLKPPPKRRMPAERRALHHDVAGALEVPDEPLCDDVGHECVRVVLALPALEFQREGQRRGKFVGVGGRELFVASGMGRR